MIYCVKTIDLQGKYLVHVYLHPEETKINTLNCKKKYEI